MTLCDASPLIALINEGDDNHQRCVDILPSLSAPLVTTCACFTEAMYLLGRYGGWFAQQELWGYVVDEILTIHHHTSDELTRMESLTDIPQVAATYAAINLNYSIHGALKQINAM
jgi:predicted nucleic acid-binding protein